MADPVEETSGTVELLRQAVRELRNVGSRLEDVAEHLSTIESDVRSIEIRTAEWTSG